MKPFVFVFLIMGSIMSESAAHSASGVNRPTLWTAWGVALVLSFSEPEILMNSYHTLKEANDAKSKCQSDDCTVAVDRSMTLLASSIAVSGTIILLEAITNCMAFAYAVREKAPYGAIIPWLLTIVLSGAQFGIVAKIALKYDGPADSLSWDAAGQGISSPLLQLLFRGALLMTGLALWRADRSGQAVELPI